MALAGALCGTVLPRVLLPPTAQARGIPVALRASPSRAPAETSGARDVQPIPARGVPPPVVAEQAPAAAAVADEVPQVPARTHRERERGTGLRGLRRGSGRWVVDLRGVDNPRALLSGMELAPPGDPPGVTDGYRVISMDRAGYARAAGIRVGDVLLAVNGRALRSADDALDAFIAVRRATRINLAFRRGASRYAVPVEVVGRPAADATASR